MRKKFMKLLCFSLSGILISINTPFLAQAATTSAQEKTSYTSLKRSSTDSFYDDYYGDSEDSDYSDDEDYTDDEDSDYSDDEDYTDDEDSDDEDYTDDEDSDDEDYTDDEDSDDEDYTDDDEDDYSDDEDYTDDEDSDDEDEDDLIPLNDCSITLSHLSYTYTGKKIKPAVTVKYDGIKLVQGVDYKITYSNNTKVTTKAKITISGIDGISEGNITLNFKITSPKKVAQKISVKKNVTIKYKKGCYNINARLKKGNGKLTYTSSNKKIAKVNKKGIVTFYKKGTVTIKVTAQKTSKYKAATQNVKLKIK